MMSPEEWAQTLADLAALYTVIIFSCSIVGFVTSKLFKWMLGKF